MTEPTINEAAVTIAAEIIHMPSDTVAIWIKAAVLTGAIPLRGTFAWDAWICYQAAVAMADAMDAWLWPH